MLSASATVAVGDTPPGTPGSVAARPSATEAGLTVAATVATAARFDAAAGAPPAGIAAPRPGTGAGGLDAVPAAPVAAPAAAHTPSLAPGADVPEPMRAAGTPKESTDPAGLPPTGGTVPVQPPSVPDAPPAIDARGQAAPRGLGKTSSRTATDKGVANDTTAADDAMAAPPGTPMLMPAVPTTRAPVPPAAPSAHGAATGAGIGTVAPGPQDAGSAAQAGAAGASPTTAMPEGTAHDPATPAGSPPDRPTAVLGVAPAQAAPTGPAAASPQPPFVLPTQHSLAAPASAPPLPAPSHGPVDAGTARAAAIGQDVGLAIARHVGGDGTSTLTIRLDPVELGRVEVRMHIDATGKMLATISADQPAALDLLRRDTDTLAQTVSQAGVQADAGSFRFDSRSGANGERAWASAAQARRTAPEDDATPIIAPPAPATGLRASGRINLVA
ncbi:flagellar hook-length control protein FliK [Sphingomonas sp. TREG-RG-20F-R18-01]|uniref:flagellar hook-length control protein FliK n=1 Tax=Sphingomonas sp. TREG-RG-20F-R18-01 TaxID=2914982 RepID=UPI001F56F067